jgi:hypothetical protein
MCPPWTEGAHTGAPLQTVNCSYFYERNLVLYISFMLVSKPSFGMVFCYYRDTSIRSG